MAKRVRLGWLGPAIVLIGAAAAGVAIWFMMTQRPVPGEVIDTFQVDGTRTLVVRREASSDRSFVELHDGSATKWSALIPRYAGSKGRPAIAWSNAAVTVRVARDGRAEVFAFAMNNAHKLGAFRLASEREPIELHAEGPITLTDHVRSYEIVRGDGWGQLIAVDLVRGGGVWKVDLGPGVVRAGGVSPGGVWLQQGTMRRVFDPATGTEKTDSKPLN